jgi:hypothetical protein
MVENAVSRKQEQHGRGRPGAARTEGLCAGMAPHLGSPLGAEPGAEAELELEPSPPSPLPAGAGFEDVGMPHYKLGDGGAVSLIAELGALPHRVVRSLDLADNGLKGPDPQVMTSSHPT